MTPPDTVGRSLRAAFVAFHLLAVTLGAFPSVGAAGMNRLAWKQPTVQGEFRAWAARLQGLGVDLDAAELEQLGWDVATAFEARRAQVLAPFQPYYEVCHTWQSWKMFVAPHRFPARLEISLDRGDGTFEPLFVARSDEYTWHAGWFGHDRMRAAVFRYGWEHFRPYRRQFADWIARVAAEEFPEAKRVQVAFVRYRTPSPDEVLSGAPLELDEPLVQVRELSPKAVP